MEISALRKSSGSVSINFWPFDLEDYQKFSDIDFGSKMMTWFELTKKEVGRW